MQRENRNKKVIPNLIWNLQRKVVSQRQQRQAWKILKHCNQTPDKDLPGRGQAVKAAVQDDNTNFTSGLPLTYHGNGFTLIELLVVVLIIGILAAVALPQYQKAVEKSKGIQALTLLKSLRQAAVEYNIANNDYPVSFDELSVEIPWTGNEQGITLGPAYIKDTRSNGEWSLQLYNGDDGKTLYMTRLTGKYKGGGFRVLMRSSASDSIVCTERKSDGIQFNLSEGEFCEKIMKGTRVDIDTVRTFRAYKLP